MARKLVKRIDCVRFFVTRTIGERFALLKNDLAVTAQATYRPNILLIPPFSGTVIVVVLTLKRSLRHPKREPQALITISGLTAGLTAQLGDISL